MPGIEALLSWYNMSLIHDIKIVDQNGRKKSAAVTITREHIEQRNI